MPVLASPRRERFAQELAKGKTQVQAYGIAGYKRNDSNAAQLANHPEVRARVTEINGKAAERAEVSVQSIIEELEEARRLALDIEQPSPAVQASMGKAKVAGLLVNRTELTGANGGPIEMNSDLDLARWIAEKLAAGEAKLIEGEVIEAEPPE